MIEITAARHPLPDGRLELLGAVDTGMCTGGRIVATVSGRRAER